MTERSARIDAFLDRAGWRGARRTALAADASFRRYHRVERAEGTALLMDAPPEKEDVRPFVTVARHLRGLGLSAPEILAEDIEAGLLLLEDFGDDTYTRRLAQGADETALYELAVDVLIELHKIPVADAIPPSLPPYDDERLLTEAEILVDYFLPAIGGRPTADGVAEAYRAAWRDVFAVARAVPETLVLRDYHVDNLMRIPGRSGVAACGLLDFQDAVAGPVSYDFVSLVEDARRDISDPLIAAMRERYLSAFPELDRGAFDASCAILGAQRHCKVIGIFTRLCVRDGKPGYLKHIPRVWRLLGRSARHPALAPVRDWLDGTIPEERRIIPPCLEAAQNQ